MDFFYERTKRIIEEEFTDLKELETQLLTNKINEEIYLIISDAMKDSCKNPIKLTESIKEAKYKGEEKPISEVVFEAYNQEIRKKIIERVKEWKS